MKSPCLPRRRFVRMMKKPASPPEPPPRDVWWWSTNNTYEEYVRMWENAPNLQLHPKQLEVLEACKLIREFGRLITLGGV